MGEHSELLREARELVRKLDRNTTSKLSSIPFESATWSGRLAPTLDAHGEGVERQDKLLAETVAACKMCDEVIGTFIGDYPGTTLVKFNASWDDLRAARHRARCVVARAEQKGDVEETMKLAAGQYDDLLKRLAEDIGDTTNQAPEKTVKAEVDADEFEKELDAEQPAPPIEVGGQGMPMPPGYSESRDAEFAEQPAQSPDWNRSPYRSEPSAQSADIHICAMCGTQFDYNVSAWANGTICSGKCLHALEQSEQPTPQPRAQRHAKVLALLDKWLADDSDYDEATWDRLKARLDPPPIEIEMRNRSTVKGYWQWQSLVSGLWVTPMDFYVEHDEADQARAAGDHWLAALSDQLGVPLVGVWEDGD